jgi:hypothetical protein
MLVAVETVVLKPTALKLLVEWLVADLLFEKLMGVFVVFPLKGNIRPIQQQQQRQ